MRNLPICCLLNCIYFCLNGCLKPLFFFFLYNIFEAIILNLSHVLIQIRPSSINPKIMTIEHYHTAIYQTVVVFFYFVSKTWLDLNVCDIYFDPKNKKWLAPIFMILTLDCEIEVFFARFMCAIDKAAALINWGDNAHSRNSPCPVTLFPLWYICDGECAVCGRECIKSSLYRMHAYNSYSCNCVHTQGRKLIAYKNARAARKNST